MKLIAVAAALAAFATASAHAATVTLDFEGVSGYVVSVGDYYAGGMDSTGRTGPNDGASFTDAAVTLSNDAAFPAYFSNAPSPTTALFAFDSSAYLNVAGGFSDAFSFYYSSPTIEQNAVAIYSGLNGTGTLLATVSLLGNAQLGCSDTAYCRFDLTSVAFAGIGRSVSFGTVSQDVLFDNVSFTPAVPEPSTWAMVVGGLGLLAVAGRRRRDRRD